MLNNLAKITVAMNPITNAITKVTMYWIIDSGRITITPGIPAGPGETDKTCINVQ